MLKRGCCGSVVIGRSRRRIAPTASPVCRTRSEEGFTLVELLVVVVIIGILIAIAIPLYTHFKEGAYEATAKSDLRTLRLEERSYNTSQPTFASTRELASANPSLRLSEGSIGAVVWSSADGFCVATTNTHAPEDRSAPFAAYGYAYRTFFFDSTTATTSTTACQAPSGATGIDGSYLDERGIH